MAGYSGQGMEGFFEKIANDPDCDKGLWHVDNASDDDINYLYKHAFAFVFPSYIEGYGLPLIEAFIREVPVIALTANIGMNIREEILDKGFQEYVAKPIRQRYLSRILVTFLPPELVKSKAKEKASATAPTEKTSTTKPEPKKDNYDMLKADSCTAIFIKAVKEMDLEQLGVSLKELSAKSFGKEADAKIKEAADAFAAYDFKRLTAIAEGIK